MNNDRIGLKRMINIFNYINKVEFENAGTILSRLEIKSIIKEIVKSFNKEYGLNVEIYPINIITYFSKEVLTKKYIINSLNIKEIVDDMTKTLAYYDENSKNITLYLFNFYNRFKILHHSDKNNEFIDLIFTVYHELGHVLQFQNNDSFFVFIVQLENTIKQNIPDHYISCHDSYFIELDADYYAIGKTKEYLEEYPEVSIEGKKHIDFLSKKYKYQLVNYDFDYFFNTFCDILPQNKNLYCNNFSWYKTFFDKDGVLRSLNDILSNEEFYKLDPRVVYSVISSDKFLSSIDFYKLNDIGRNILMQSLEYKYEIIHNQYILNLSYPFTKEKLQNKLDSLEKYIFKVNLKNDREVIHK